MKNLILSLILIVFTTLAVSSQNTSVEQSEADKQREMDQRKMEQQRMAEQRRQKEKEQADAQANNPNAPIIKFDKLVHDYGTLQQHGDGKCKFTFTNEGKEPLILSNVRSSCGCTVPTWPRQPILPGQSEIIKVKYDTKRVGIINKSIHVYSNAQKSPLTLKIKGKIDAASASAVPEKKVSESNSPVNK